MDYKNMIKHAVQEHRRVSAETAGLYKRHTLPLEAPAIGKHPTKVSLDGLRKAIAAESRLRFDLVYDGKKFSFNNKFVRVVKNARGSGGTIIVKVPDGETARLNFLILCGAGIPIEIAVGAGRGSSLNLFEWYGSAPDAVGVVAPLRAIDADSDSRVEISALHNEGVGMSVESVCSMVAHERASVVLNNIHIGASTMRSTSIADAHGAEGSVAVNDVVFGASGQKFDILSLASNSAPRTKALVKSSCVLSGGSISMLKGNARVAKSAKGSVSRVEERALLLDRGSRAQLLPDMSVACSEAESASHSASVAPIDGSGLFYLMSRGVDAAKARRMLVSGFLSGRLSGIGSDTVKEVAMSLMLDKFGSGRQSGSPRISARDIWTAPVGGSR
jgi:Fe-S cluster assembly scaffold protein SufB